MMMLLLPLLGVIASIGAVSGIPVDFDQDDDYQIDGFLSNDISVDGSDNGLQLDSFPTYGSPDDLDPGVFSFLRDTSDAGAFSLLPDEQSNEPSDEPTNDSAGQFSNPPIANLIDFNDSGTLSSSCDKDFGLACCTGGSYEVLSGEALHLQDVSGCSGHDSSRTPCKGGLYCCFSFPAPTAYYNAMNVDGTQCYPIPSQVDIPAIKTLP